MLGPRAGHRRQMDGKLGARHSLPGRDAVFAGMSGEWREERRKIMERRVDMRGRVSRLYQAAPLISVVWGASSYCLFSEAQAPTSSLLTLGRLLGRRPRSFLGRVHWGCFPTTAFRLQRPWTQQRSG